MAGEHFVAGNSLTRGSATKPPAVIVERLRLRSRAGVGGSFVPFEIGRSARQARRTKNSRKVQVQQLYNSALPSGSGATE